MPSRDEIAGGLAEFMVRAEELPTISHKDVRWDLWKDEVLSYLRRTLGQDAEKEFKRVMAVSTIAWWGDEDVPYVNSLSEGVKKLAVMRQRVIRGEYDAQLQGSPDKVQEHAALAPSVFIAHSGEPPALHRLTRFLEALGVKPVIAEWLPFRGAQVPDHARSSMDGCDAAIVFATVSDAAGQRQQPGPGALIETGILQERFGDRVIYLVEKGAHFGPMADGFAHESFTRNCLEKAFHRIVVELRAHKVI